MPYPTIDEIRDIWSEFAEKLNAKNWLEPWNKTDYDWTQYVLGSKSCAINQGSPLGDFFISKIANTSYRKEDALFDLVVYRNTFHEVETLHDKDERQKIVLDKLFFPIDSLIIIEHENNVLMCYDEMIKLTYVKGLYKILITYNYDEEENNDYAEIAEVLKSNFKNIIKHSNEFQRENPDTVYILIIGQKRLNNKLSWNFSHFTVN